MDSRDLLETELASRKVPRYRAVSAALRKQVAEGKLAAGAKLPALHELADHFKVSTHTVRCAIRLLEREGCLRRVPDVGSFVQAQAASTNRSTVVALVTIDIGGAFELGIARGIERACRERGWELLIYDSRGEAQAEEESLRRLHENNGARGIIVVPTGSHDNIESLFKLKLAGTPMVLLDRGIAGLKVDLVESAHEMGGYLATRYLLDRGHPQVFMLTEPVGVASIQARINGYERALREAGLEARQDWKLWVDPEISIQGVREDRRWFGGYQAAIAALKTLKPPLAFFTLNDYIAWGLCRACTEMGLIVPNDVSIVCFDDSDITRAMNPPLTVIAQPAEELGKKAVELLGRRFKSPGTEIAPENVSVDVQLIERESVATLARAGP